MYKTLKKIKNKNMLKYFIIMLVVIVIVSFLFIIKVEARFVKRINNPFIFKIMVFNKIIYYKIIKSKKKKKLTIKGINIFDADLNIVLKDLKKENFFVTLILEYGSLKKVTLIPAFNSEDPMIMPYLGVLDWYIASSVKRYIDYTFSNISDDYYQIILLKDDTQGINFEIYITISLMELIVAIISNFKVFLKIFKKKDGKYE